MDHQENGLRSERGYTFIELIVALAVLAIAALPLTALFSSAHAGMIRAGRRTAALNLCREKMEQIKAGGFVDHGVVLNGPEGCYREVEERAGAERLFRRETRLEPAITAGPPEGAPLISISVTVSWPEGEKVHSVRLESYRAVEKDLLSGRI